MNISKSRKTMRVLYLYLTIPLLLITMLLFAVALMSATKKPAPASEMSSPAAGSAETKTSDPAERPRRPSVEVAQPEAKEEKASDTTAGQTAIITAIMTGITGLLGAIVQVVIAFMKMHEKRKSEHEA